jgi:GR25 family glycosyltransferase involved in LPS biosynthesis
MKKYSLHFEFFNATDGELLSKEVIDKSRERSNNWYKKDEGEDKSMRLAEIGVAISHYNIYQKILKEKIEFAIIMEDDASFDERFALFITRLKNIKRVLEKFDLILLGYCTHDLNYRIPGICSYWGVLNIGKGFKVGIPLKWYWSAIGYIISYKGALLLSEKQGAYPCVTADILTANSPKYGAKLGILTNPIIWPGELSQISTIQVGRTGVSPAYTPIEYPSRGKKTLKSVLKIPQQLKNFLREVQLKLDKRKYLFTTDKY